MVSARRRGKKSLSIEALAFDWLIVGSEKDDRPFRERVEGLKVPS